MFIHKNNQTNKEYGFALIEMIVVIFIFLTVLGMGTGIFVLATKNQRKAIAFQNVVDNTRYALEEMSRGIRVSKITSPSGTTSTISIDHPTQGPLTYCRGESGSCSATGTSLLKNNLPLTSDDVQINYLDFRIKEVGTAPPNEQPRVTITLEAQSADAGPSPEIMNLQITLSPRPLDVP